MDFKRFYFEGNEYWGYINTLEELQVLLKVYPYEELRKAQRYYKSENFQDPQFGFYAEYNDKYTLGDWVDENGLEQFFKQ